MALRIQLAASLAWLSTLVLSANTFSQQTNWADVFIDAGRGQFCEYSSGCGRQSMSWQLSEQFVDKSTGLSSANRSIAYGNLKNLNGMVLFHLAVITSDSPNTQKNDQVIASNQRYSFQLARRGQETNWEVSDYDAPWQYSPTVKAPVNGFKHVEALSVMQKQFNNMGADATAHFFTVGFGIPLDGILSSLETKDIISAKPLPVEGLESAVEIQFRRNTGETVIGRFGQAHDVSSLSGGTVIFDVGGGWIPVEGWFEHKKDSWEMKNHFVWLYDNRTSLPQLTTRNEDRAIVVTGGANVELKQTVSNIMELPLPDRTEFTLSYYGLPEFVDGGGNYSRLIWGTGGAAFFLILFVVGRRLVR